MEIGARLAVMGVAAVLLTGMGVRAAEPPMPVRHLYVSPRGDDGNDGRAPERAFRTIRRAAAMVEPGDLVHVAGGTYFEHVHLTRPGTAERPIVFRAEPRETALVTFGEEPAAWQKVAGRRFVYAAPYARLPVSVWEDRTITRYVELRSPALLDDQPGSFFFDRDRALLSVHPLRGDTPEAARVLVIPASDRRGEVASLDARTPEMNDRGFWQGAPYAHVEGFTICYQPIGIQIRADACEARNNTVYGCIGGLNVAAGENARIERNVAFRNDSHGIVTGGGSQRVMVRGNLCFDNGPAGPLAYLYGAYGEPMEIAVYGRSTDVVFTENRVIATRPDRVWRYKSAYSPITTTRNVIVGGRADVNLGRGMDYSSNTVVGGALWSRDERPEEITPEVARQQGAVAEKNLYVPKSPALEAGFADPLRHDYRLRADSPHRGVGAFAEPAPLRYVAPAGRDSADGRTPMTAWRTLGKAAVAARPGDTVYVLPGTYAESVTITTPATAGQPLAFRTYGRGRVVLDGQNRLACGLRFRGAAHVTLDGFIVRGYTQAAVRIEESAEIEIVESVLDGAPVGIDLRGARGVRVLNDTLSACGTGIAGRGGGELTLRNTLFAAIRAAGVTLDQSAAHGLVSERNAFDLTAPAVAGVLAGRRAVAVADWTTLAGEAHPSLTTRAPIAAPDYHVPTGSRPAFLGLGHRPLGARGAAPEESPVAIEGFKAVSLLPDQAVLAWSTPRDYATAVLTWEGPGSAKGTLAIPQDKYLQQTRGAARLPGLAPGREYRVVLHVSSPDGRSGQAALTFRVPSAARAPVTLHVAPDGDDRNDGSSPSRALRTLRMASLQAVPGDTVLVHPGVYAETLRLWCGGLSRAKPLTFRSVRPGAAVIDLEGVLSSAIVMADLAHVVIEGFRIRGLRYGGSVHAVEAVNTTDLELAHTLFEPPPWVGCTGTLVYARGCRDLRLRGNHFLAGFYGAQIYGSDGVEIDHNTFYGGGVNALLLDGRDDFRCRITNNIFADVMAANKSNPAVAVYRRSPHLVVDHNLYWRRAVPQMGLFSFLRTESDEVIAWNDNPKTIEETRARWGLERHGAFGDPLFADPAAGDFRVKPGSPAIGMAGEGRVAGASPALETGRE